MTKEPGIYIVTLNNELPISINAQDPRHADKVYKANYKNIKVGKAKSLNLRMNNYFKTFGEENVNFLPVILTKEIDRAEKILKKELDSFRVINPVSNKKTEWLIGITKERLLEIVVTNIRQSDINHSLSDSINLRDITMNICVQLINSAQYLEEHGLTQKQLSSLHHFSLKGREVSFKELQTYFGDNKELRTRNSNFANRVIYVANQYKKNKGNFSQLIEQALKEWPLI